MIKKNHHFLIISIILFALTGLLFGFFSGREALSGEGQIIFQEARLWQIAADDVTDYKFPGAGAQVTKSGSTGNWDNPSYITASNNNYAYEDLSSGAETHWLVGTQYGFTNSDIPAGAQIDGIEIEIEWYSEDSTDVDQEQCYLTKNGTVTVGTDHFDGSTGVRTTEGTDTFGGPTDKWGTTWTDTEIKASTFGVMMTVENVDTRNARQIRVDTIRVRVYYTVLTTAEVTTNAATNVATTSATLNATLDIGTFGAIDTFFNYGTSTVYTATTSLETQTASTTFSASTTGLDTLTIYHFRGGAASSTNYYFGDDYDFMTGDVSIVESTTTEWDLGTFATTSTSTDGVVLEGGAEELEDSENFEAGIGDWADVACSGCTTECWERAQTTGSTGTGPDDGQENTGSAWFRFLEASSGYCYDLNDEDYIEYTFTSATPTDGYIDFYYHMYGADMGEFAFESYNGSSWDTNWATSGQKHLAESDPYTRASSTFSNAEKLRFRGTQTVGAAYTSDMAVDVIGVYVGGGYETSGYRISPALDVGTISNVDDSKIEWSASTTGATATIAIYTEINTSSITPPTSGWNLATSGEAMADLTGDLSGKYLWVKQEFSTADTNITPTLHWIGYAINESLVTGPSLQQNYYRWRDDTVGLDTDSGWLAATNTQVIVNKNTTTRLRTEIANTGAETAADTQYLLEYAEKNGSCGSFSAVPITAGSSHFVMVDSSQYADNANITTSVLPATGAWINGKGIEYSSNKTSAFDLASTTYTEFEYAIQATDNATTNQTYCFRLTDNGATTTFTYDAYPEFTIAADVTVSTAGTQTSPVYISTADNYIGGKFVITENISSRNVTGITITEYGTVDAQNNLDNIELYYDLDQSPPYDCASEEYNVGEDSQFGSTDTDGFSGINGSSTFTGSVAISTTSTMCVYTVLDVGSGASASETIDIKIANPFTEVAISSGGTGPTTAVEISGQSTIASHVTVGTYGTQTATLYISLVNQHVGGMFTIAENEDTRNVTSIIITEHGTVDAQNDLDNIKLYYDLDTSNPYNCASESYGGGENQFGSTDTDGFSGINGSSTFTGSVAISTTSTMCVYTVLDVGSGASASETIDIKINNPPTEVAIDSGSIGPATAVEISGQSTLAAASINGWLGKSQDGWSGAVPVYATTSWPSPDDDYYARAKVDTPAPVTWYATMTWNGANARFEGTIYIGSNYCNGCADPNTGTFTVTVQMDDDPAFGSVNFSDSAGTFSTFITRRWNAITNAAMGNSTEFNPTWNAGGWWDYSIEDLSVNAAATYSNVAIAIPFHPTTATITNMAVTLAAVSLDEGTAASTTDCWWWDDGTHTLYIQDNSIGTTYKTVTLNFDSDTDLFASRIDRVYTTNMGERLFYNGLMWGNNYIGTGMFGGGHEGAGEQMELQARDFSTNNDVSVDCMERVGVHVDNTTISDGTGYYDYNIKWQQQEWAGYIVSEDNNSIVTRVTSDGAAGGWAQQLNNGIAAYREQTFYANERYIKNVYQFTNNGGSTRIYPMVWGREQWIGTDTYTNDEGRYAGDTVDVSPETHVAISSLGEPWMTSYDTGVYAAMGMCFQESDPARYGYFLTAPALGSPAIVEWVNQGSEYRPDDNDAGANANDTFFDKVWPSVAAGASTSLTFWQWGYDTTSWANIESAISADCTALNIAGIDVSGTVYTDEGTTTIGVGRTVRVKVNGAGDYTASTTAGGAYTISNVTINSVGDTITAFLDAGTYSEKANAITTASSTNENITGLNLYQNRIIVTHPISTPLSIVNLAQYTNASDADMLFSATSSTGELTASSASEFYVWDGKTFNSYGTAGAAGTVSLADLDIRGTFTASSTQIINVSGNWSASSTATAFNSALSTTNFTSVLSTTTITTEGSPFYNLTFNGAGGVWTFQDAATTTNDLTITQGTASSTYNMYVYGGDVTGNGTLNWTSGTFLLDGNGSFGGTQNWNFYNLTFGNGSGTENATSTSTGTTTVSNALTVAASQTLNAGEKPWVLSGGGTPFTKTGTFTAATSTFYYTSTSNATVTATTYYNLNLNPAGAPTYNLESGTLTANNYLTIGDGTNGVTVNADNNGPNLDINGNFTISANATFVASQTGTFNIGSNWLNSGTFTHSNGTTTFDATASGKTITTNGSPFYNLTFNGSGGAWSFSSANASTTNNFTITAGTVTAPSAILDIGNNYSNSGTFNSASSTVQFTATSTGKTIAGSLNGSNSFYKVEFNGSGGAWTIQDAMKVSSANAADAFVVKQGTVTMGDGNADDLEVLGKLVVGDGTGNATLTTPALSQGDSLTIHINASSSPPACSNCIIQVGTTTGSGVFELKKNVTLTFNSNASVESGLEVESTGYLHIEGEQATTSAVSFLSEDTASTTITVSGTPWSADQFNNMHLRISSVASSTTAFGKIYDVLDTTANTIKISATSSSGSTIQSVSGTGPTRTVCSNSTTIIVADNEGVGRYLHDQTGAAGYLKIIDSTNNDSGCSTPADSFKVIAEPDSLSSLATNDAIDISDGIMPQDGFEILDYAVITAETDNHGYIYTKAGSETLIRYADISELGADTSTKYGVNFYDIDGGNANEGITIENSRIHDGYRGISLYQSPNNNGTKGFENNAAYNNSSHGFYIYSYSHNSTLSHNTSYSNGEKGFWVENSDNNTISSNASYNNGNFGFYLSYSSHNITMSSNTSYSNGSGINAIGFNLFHSHNNIVSFNSSYNNSYRGFYVDESYNNTIYSNDSYKNTEGFTVELSHNNILSSNNSYSNLTYGFYLYFSSYNNILLYNNSYNNQDGLYIYKDIDGTIAISEDYEANDTDVKIVTVVSTSSSLRCYSCDFNSSGEAYIDSGSSLISFKYDSLATSTKLWGEYAIPDDDSETPQDEGTYRFNYADNLWEDSFTPHGYFGTGQEDPGLDFSFNGAMSGANSAYVYSVTCKASGGCASGGSNDWDVFRDGVDIDDASTDTQYTDSTTNARFTIQDVGTNYVKGDTYTFVIWKQSSNTDTQKFLTIMQNGDTFTVPNGTTLEIKGGGSGAGQITTLNYDPGYGSWNFYNNTGNELTFQEAIINSVQFTSGTTTVLNTVLNNETVTGGALNVDWYLGVHVVAEDSTSTDIDTGNDDITISTPWYDSSWDYRKEITIDHTKVAGDLTNFPVLVSTSSDPDLASRAQPDGDDILFTLADGITKLDHEIEKFSSSTGELVAWIEHPSLSSSTDTHLYMYYGNSSSSNQQNVSGTWDSNFVMVQHHQESTSTIYDSTSNNNNGSPVGSPIYGQTGQIGETIDYESDNPDRFDMGSLSQEGNDLTIEFWINLESYSGLASSTNLAPIIIDWMSGVGGSDGTLLCYIKTNPGWSGGSYATNGVICTYSSSDTQLNDVGTETAIATGTWHYIAFTLDDTDWRAYYNGSQENNVTGAGNISPEDEEFSIGFRSWNWGEDIDGLIDEVRLSKEARPGEWISTSYNNQNSPSTFYDLGDEESFSSLPAVIWRHNGSNWGTASSSQTTGSGADGKSPQPNSDGAIRIREYKKTAAATTTYKYNLTIAAPAGFIDYDYYNDLGSKYIASTLSADADVDLSISENWQRSTIGSLNGTKDYDGLNEPPLHGTWYAGLTPDLQFSIDFASIDLTLNEANDFTATSSLTLSATTSYAGGFIITAHMSDTQGKLATSGAEIIRFDFNNDSPAAWDAYCNASSSRCGFGYTTSDSTLGITNPDRFTNSTFCGATGDYCWAGFAISSSGDPIGNRTSSGAESYTTIVKASVDSNQRADAYAGTIYYICTANY